MIVYCICTDLFPPEIENNESQSNQRSSEINDMCNDTDKAYYNITSMEKRSPTAIMLKDLVELVLTGRSMKQKLEEQFDVNYIYS